MMPSLWSLKSLYRQSRRSRRQKRKTHNALWVDGQREEHLVRLQAEPEGRTSHPFRAVCVVVRRPPFREIFAAGFRDLVDHHAAVEALEGV